MLTSPAFFDACGSCQFVSPTIYSNLISKISELTVLANNTFGFEDVPGGGDTDFDDLVV